MSFVHNNTSNLNSHVVFFVSEQDMVQHHFDILFRFNVEYTYDIVIML